MRFSVLVVSYRRPDDLERCLRSLACQVRLPDEVILATVATDTATDVVLERWQTSGELPGLAHIKTPEPSILAQENLALAHATGDVVCFIDDDAEAFPDWLANIEAHYRDSQIGAVGGPDYIYDNGQRVTGNAEVIGRVSWLGKVTGNHHLPGDRVVEVDLLKGCNMSYRRHLVPRLDPGIIGQFAHHWELETCLNIKRQGYSLIYDPCIRVNHYIRRSMAYREQHFVLGDYLYMINHNHLYALLKHSGSIQQLFRLLWIFLWGDYPEMGLAVFGKTCLKRLIRHGNLSFIRLLGPTLWGKMDALRVLANSRNRMLGDEAKPFGI